MVIIIYQVRQLSGRRTIVATIFLKITIYLISCISINLQICPSNSSQFTICWSNMLPKHGIICWEDEPTIFSYDTYRWPGCIQAAGWCAGSSNRLLEGLSFLRISKFKSCNPEPLKICFSHSLIWWGFQKARKWDKRSILTSCLFWSMSLIALLHQGFGGRSTPTGQKLQPEIWSYPFWFIQIVSIEWLNVIISIWPSESRFESSVMD